MRMLCCCGFSAYAYAVTVGGIHMWAYTWIMLMVTITFVQLNGHNSLESYYARTLFREGLKFLLNALDILVRRIRS